MGELTVFALGRVEYEDGLALQAAFSQSRREQLCGDTLLLLEHPAVLTLGRGGKPANVLVSNARLAELDVQLHHTDRGGDVTYHGPGQLVGYPLMYLPPGEQDVRRYVRRLEEVIIRTLRHFGIDATRVEKWPGVWVERSRLGGLRKIAALGVHLSRWYTRHGFALNVDPKLAHFELIVPCGISEAGVTSMAVELGQAPAMKDVEAVVTTVFAEVFERAVAVGQPRRQTVAVAVVRDDRALVLKRTEAKGGFWQLVTGGIEAGETPSAAAARELKEETGFSSPVFDLKYQHAFGLGEARPPVLTVEHGFGIRVDAGADPVIDPAEHDELRWLPIAEALELLPYEGLRQTLRRTAAR